MEDTARELAWSRGSADLDWYDRAAVTPGLPDRPSDSFSRAFAAGFERDFPIASLVKRLSSPIDEEAAAQLSDETPDNWNYMKYGEDNFPEWKQPWFRSHRASFYDVASPLQFERRMARYRDEHRLEQEMALSPTGSFLGGVTAAVTDPLSYTPFIGPVNRFVGLARLAERGSRVRALALEGVLSGTVPEALLQATQNTRDTDESLATVMASAMLGAGIGGVARWRQVGHAMNPGHPANPLNPKNQDVHVDVVRDAEGGVHVSGGGSGGAMSVDEIGDVVRQSPPSLIPTFLKRLPFVGDTLERGAQKLLNVTSVYGRMITSPLDTVRTAGALMFDQGGLNLTTHINKSAQDFVNTGKQLTNENIRSFVDARTRLAEDFAKLNLKPLNEAEFDRWMAYRASGSLTERRVAQLSAQYGEAGARSVINRLNEVNSVWQKNYAKHVEDGVALGRIRNVPLYDKAVSDAKTARATLRERKLARTEAAKSVEGGAEKASAIDAEIENIRRTIERNDKIVALQESLAPPLEGDYHPILYNRERLVMAPGEFEQMVQRKLADNVDAEFANDIMPEWRFTDADLKKLGNEEVQLAKADGELVTMGVPEGRALKNEIVDRYIGDRDVWTYDRLEGELKTLNAHHSRLEADMLNQKEIADELRNENGKYTRAIEKSARERLRITAEVGRIKLAHARAMEKELVEAATAARQIGVARDLTHREIISQEAIEAADDAVIMRQLELEDLVMRDMKDPLIGPDRYRNSGTYVKSKDALVNSMAYRNRLMTGPRETIDVTPGMIKSEARTQMAHENVLSAEARVRDAEKRLASFDSRIEEMKGIRDQIALREADAARVLKGVAERLGVAEGTVSAVKAKMAAIEKEGGMGFESQMRADAKRITQNILTRHSIPNNRMQENVRKSGRIKARQLDWTPEEMGDLLDRQWVKPTARDAMQIANSQFAGQLGVQHTLRALGVDTQGELRDRILMEANEKGQQAHAQEALKFLDASINRITGMVDQDVDPASALGFGGRMARHATTVRYSAGTGLASVLGDAATTQIANSKFFPAVVKFGMDMQAALKGSADAEIRSMIDATEAASNSMHGRWNIHELDMGEHYGMGAPDSTLRKITGAVEKGAATVGTFGYKVGGQQLQTTFSKQMVMQYTLNTPIMDWVPRYASLSNAEKYDLRRLGIDAASASRIAKQIEKHADVSASGVPRPNLDLWRSTTEGAKAADAVLTAMNRNARLSIGSAGPGDLPLIADKAMGKLWLNFMSYNFWAFNNVIYPAAQRLGEGDARVLAGLSMMLVAGTGTVVMKEAIRDPAHADENVKKLFDPNVTPVPQLLYNILDRSSFFAHLSPFIQTALGVTDGAQRDVLGYSLNRYAPRSPQEALDPLLGIPFGFAQDLTTAMYQTSRGDLEKMQKAWLNLAPLQMYSKGIGRTLDAISNE